MIFLLGMLSPCFHSPSYAATIIPLTVTLSEPVTVTGTPRIAVDVDGTTRLDGSTRYALFSAGSGTNTLTFNYTMEAGDLDLNGIAVASPVELNGGTIKDLSGNDATLTFTPPNTANVKANYPSLSMDFVYDDDGKYSWNGTSYDTITTFLAASGGSFTRASNATYYDSTGTLQIAGNNVLRFDHDPVTLVRKGALIEEQRTNYVANSQFQGAAIGVSPPNISINPGGAGITASVTGVGTLNGENYLDVTFSGTSTAGAQIYPNISFVSNVPATMGQSWTGTVRLISNTGTSSVTPYLEVAELSAAGAYLAGTGLSLTSTGFKRVSRTFNNASTTKTRWLLIFSMAPGQSVNRTLRLSIPQFEQGGFPTSYIPTTTAAATRSADNFYISTASWLGSSVGTLSSESIIPYLGGSSYPGPAALNDTTPNNAVECLINDGSTDTRAANIYTGGTGEYGGSMSAYTAGNTFKCAVAYQLNDARSSIDGTLNAADTNVTVPTITQLSVGTNRGASGKLNGWLRNVKYYPRRVTDSQVQLLTQ